MLEDDAAEALRFVGTVGGVTSGASNVTVAVALVLPPALLAVSV